MKISILGKILLLTCVNSLCGLFFCSCVQDESMGNMQGSDRSFITRSDDLPNVHWRCREVGCGFLNPPWRAECFRCEKPYNPYHGGLMVEYFQKILQTSVGFDTGAGLLEKINDTNIANRILLPDAILLEFAPSPWYDTYKSQTYYENLKTLSYYSDVDYAEGVDLGWYRTVRILYPGISNVAKVQSIYDKWLIRDGRFMKDSFGRGLKAGTKAAVDAFGAR